ncbi:MAG: type III-A CRISPR-associated RAMP protein Csm5 [Acidobacteriaceae bacterium]|nr:type III-A CRISPR-associated RAMP protein Csm5 [Acidobacteriaceae bacterium]MBV9500927.1 type III-A CRISPR-associated RAMP protein Csm5 [Acidobacteriaceae bacterium]
MRFELTALTPLLVGDGRELAPIDYMVWKDQVNVLDQSRIFRLLARGPRLDGYLAQLRRATKLDFASWGGFAQNFSARRIPFENPASTAIWNSAQSESLFIPTFAANLNGPYLPASAVKGALRTGLVFTRWSAGTMDRIASSLEGERLSRRTAEAAELNAGASQSKVISMADGRAERDVSFKIYLTRVASLDTRQPEKPQLAWKLAGRGSVPAPRVSESTPLFAEMAAPESTFTGEWEERSFLKNEDLLRAMGWRSAPSAEMIANAANEYAEKQLALHAQFAEMSGLTGVRDTVGRLGQELQRSRGNPMTCLLCLGWGGGFVSKSAFLETSQESHRKVLRTVPAMARAIRDQVPFPKTRRIVFTDSQPSTLPGWATLHLKA